MVIVSADGPRARCCAAGWTRPRPEILLGADRRNRDALHGRTRWVSASIEDTGKMPVPPGKGDLRYAAAWRQAEAAARHALDDALDAATDLIEPKAAWLLARHLPEATPLFVASSMPVRDLEYFWPAR